MASELSHFVDLLTDAVNKFEEDHHATYLGAGNLRRLANIDKCVHMRVLWRKCLGCCLVHEWPLYYGWLSVAPSTLCTRQQLWCLAVGVV